MSSTHESEHDLLCRFGGRAYTPDGTRITSSADADATTAYNFGVLPKTSVVEARIMMKPSLHIRFPAMAGKWDGVSTVNHWDAVRTVLGTDKAEELIQYQPRGTCGGRAGSLAGDMVQCIMIASGKNAKFHRVSHAGVYYVARKKYNDIGGDWRNERNDGVASGSVPLALAEMGAVQREEDGDLNWYGDGSDDLACQLAAGLHPEVAKRILDAGGDNLITEWIPVKNAQELADGIAAGGIGLGSDNQGFTMTRDSQGFCRPTGTWSHYQVRGSVGVFGGRKGFGYCQSWGKGTPGGPLLPGHPSNCFGVDFNVQDQIIKSGDWCVVFGFPLWNLEEGGKDIPWLFR